MAKRRTRSEAVYVISVAAELAGVHPTYVGMVERGVRNPTLDVAERLARALRVALPKLIEEAQSQRGSRGRKS